MQQTESDGVKTLVPRDKSIPSARKLRDAYARISWRVTIQKRIWLLLSGSLGGAGHAQDVPLAELFDYDPPGNHGLGQLGWCEAAFDPSSRTRSWKIAASTSWCRTLPGGTCWSSRAVAAALCRSTSIIR